MKKGQNVTTTFISPKDVVNLIKEQKLNKPLIL